MTKIFVDRSRIETTHRCRRLRWLEYHSGSAHRGLVPKKKSIHLVLGRAVHAGLAVLLQEGQAWLNRPHHLGHEPELAPLNEQLDFMFVGSGKVEGMNDLTVARNIEDEAVAAALLDLKAASTFGVELDDLEQEGMKKLLQAVAATGEGALQQVSMAGDSPLTIDFSDMFAAAPTLPAMDGLLTDANISPTDYTGIQRAPTLAEFQVVPTAPVTSFHDALKASLTMEQANTTTELDWGAPVYLDEQKPNPAVGLAVQSPEDQLLQQEIRTDANQARVTGLDSYLKDELAALVEAMVRAYARRRWRPLLEDHEVLEIEREGEWKLAEVQETCPLCNNSGIVDLDPDPTNPDPFIATAGDTQACDCGGRGITREIWFMSRHDGLLLERKTGFLYLLSYKTTGAWDRRREADAQVDMQGLSEAVDVEKRFEEAWNLIHQGGPAGSSDGYVINVLKDLVDDRTVEWLTNQPEPPKILGVRYEYLLKGQRRADKYDQELPGRYVADTPLIRGLKFDNITVDDRRWAHSRDYFTEMGKSSSLYWKNWKKAPVWRYMTVAQWIDMLDRGEVQPDAYDERGGKVDCLADQFCTPITVFRSDDSMRDMLESLEAEETENAQKVMLVRQAEAIGDAGLIRSALNKNFGRSLKACSYPGKCSHWESCHGSPVIQNDPENSGLYTIRIPNHPVEASGQ